MPPDFTPDELAILNQISPTKHIIERTSPKGQAFIGTCARCGQTDLPITAAKEPCRSADAVAT